MISISPQITKTASGTFGVQWDGLVQGTAWPAPNAIFNLAGGWVASSETDPMYAGLAITENVPTQPGSPPSTPAVELGGAIKRASTVPALAGTVAQTDITGFVVSDQNYAMINSPQSPVQLADIGMQVNFYRLGSGARLCVAMDPALVSLYGTIITGPVGWDFVNQRITVPGAAPLPNVKVLRAQPAGNMTITYTSATKQAQWNYNGSAAVILL
jgi:hypothetical protein